MKENKLEYQYLRRPPQGANASESHPVRGVSRDFIIASSSGICQDDFEVVAMADSKLSDPSIDFAIKQFEKEDIDGVIAFERELREQEPDTYFWEPDAAYRKQLEQSFEDERFNTAMSYIAVKDNKVIGRIDVSLVSSRSDASCFSAYMDWICVLKSERHHQVAQALLRDLRKACKERGVGVLIALMANNKEAQSFYQRVENTSIHDTGIWMDIQ